MGVLTRHPILCSFKDVAELDRSRVSSALPHKRVIIKFGSPPLGKVNLITVMQSLLTFFNSSTSSFPEYIWAQPTTKAEAIGLLEYYRNVAVREGVYSRSPELPMGDLTFYHTVSSLLETARKAPTDEAACLAARSAAAIRLQPASLKADPHARTVEIV